MFNIVMFYLEKLGSLYSVRIYFLPYLFSLSWFGGKWVKKLWFVAKISYWFTTMEKKIIFNNVLDMFFIEINKEEY